jgi:hypothetical protein
MLLYASFTFHSTYGLSQQDISDTIIKDSMVRIFYDVNAKILDMQDSNQARYYRVINYRDSKILGPVTDYYISGMPYMIGYYTDNKIGKGYENGKFTYYFENGKIFQIRNYVNGLLDSAFLEFYPSGARKARVSYSKGNRYGCEYAWDENGNLIHQAFIENNQVTESFKCDTTNIDYETIVDSTIRQHDFYSKIVPSQDDYKVIDNSFYFRAKRMKVLSISLVNDQDEKISFSHVKMRETLTLKIRFSGLILKDGMYHYLQEENLRDSEGVDMAGGTGDLSDDTKLDVIEARFIVGLSEPLPNNVTTKDFYLSINIQDRNSFAGLHGFIKYTIMR